MGITIYIVYINIGLLFFILICFIVIQVRWFLV